MYLEAVDQAITREQLNGRVIKSGTYTIMNNGNLCYVTDGKCPDKNQITVQVDGTPLTTGSVVIQDGEIANVDTRNIENVNGAIIVSGKVRKEYNEETGKSYVYVTITFDELLGDASINQIFSGIDFGFNDLTAVDYIRSSSVTDYAIGAHDNIVTILSSESSNKIYAGDYITLKFTTDDLDSVDVSQISYYVNIGTLEHKNVPIQQSSTSEITINNYSKENINIFKAVKSDSYDYVPGDINDDGYIDGYDLSYLRQNFLDKIGPCKAMDVNGDGVIDIKDLVRFKKFLIFSGELEYSSMTGVPGHL